MKITPSNQTLILASERRGTASQAGAAPSKSSSSNGAVLQRVTIVASQPDSTVVYLRADYATPGGAGAANGTAEPPDADFAESSAGGAPYLIGSSSAGHTATRAASAGSALVVGAQKNDNPLRDGYGNTISRRDAAISSYLPPVEQYAQTQRLGGITPAVQRIDVHA